MGGRPRRWGSVFAAAFLMFLLGCSSPPRGDASDRPPPGEPAAWRSEPAEPCPFLPPIPPREPTPLDGIYVRSYAEGLTPIPCVRCAPFRLDRGRATLVLDSGRYYIRHPASDFSTSGHFLAEGNTLVLFNDANCPETRGSYRWVRRGDSLSFEAVDDPCPFDQLRARYLSAAAWQAGSGA